MNSIHTPRNSVFRNERDIESFHIDMTVYVCIYEHELHGAADAPTASCPSPAAAMSAVIFSSDTASTSTFLLSTSSFTTSTRPLCAARISVVTPCLSCTHTQRGNNVSRWTAGVSLQGRRSNERCSGIKKGVDL